MYRCVHKLTHSKHVYYVSVINEHRNSWYGLLSVFINERKGAGKHIYQPLHSPAAALASRRGKEIQPAALQGGLQGGQSVGAYIFMVAFLCCSPAAGVNRQVESILGYRGRQGIEGISAVGFSEVRKGERKWQMCILGDSGGEGENPVI